MPLRSTPMSNTWLSERPSAVTCVYKPSVNEFRGERRLQLQLDVIGPLLRPDALEQNSPLR